MSPSNTTEKDSLRQHVNACKQVNDPTPTPVSVRDRFRTMINVLGDALAAGIMAHLCKKDFDKTSNSAEANAPPAANDQRVS